MLESGYDCSMDDVLDFDRGNDELTLPMIRVVPLSETDWPLFMKQKVSDPQTVWETHRRAEIVKPLRKPYLWEGSG
ncbi:MAG: hypothetical protein ACJZ70_10245 [Limisphaerales bacterium]